MLLVGNPMGSVAQSQDDKKELVRDVHKLARLGVQFVDSTKGGVMVHNGSKLSFVAGVKAKQGLDRTLVEQKETVLKISIDVFYQGGDRVCNTPDSKRGKVSELGPKGAIQEGQPRPVV